MAVTRSYRTHVSHHTASNTDPITFSSVDIGTAAADRIVVLAGLYVSSLNPDSVTIGGVTATVYSSTLFVAWAVVPTGTTANIVFDMPSTGSAVDTNFTVYATYGARQSNPFRYAPVDTLNLTDLNNTGVATNEAGFDQFDDAYAGDVAIAFGYAGLRDDSGASITHTWTDFTEEFDTMQDYAAGASLYIGFTTASKAYGSDDDNIAPTCTYINAETLNATLMVIFVREPPVNQSVTASLITDTETFYSPLHAYEPQRYTVTADDTDGGWKNASGNNTNLFASIDETASPNDSDYIHSTVMTGAADLTKIKLDTLDDPAEPLHVRYRYKTNNTTPVSRKITLVVRLKEGTTTRASKTHTGISELSFVDGEFTLTAGEFAAITDFSNLYLEFDATVVVTAFDNLYSILSAAAGGYGMLEDAADKKKLTVSCFVKPAPTGAGYCLLGQYNEGAEAVAIIFSSLTVGIQANGGADGDAQFVGALTADVWNHILVQFDTAQGTASDRAKLFINGVQKSLTFNQNFTSNLELAACKASAVNIITFGVGGVNFFDECCIIPGEVWAASVFANGNAAKWAEDNAFPATAAYIRFDTFVETGDDLGYFTDSSGNANHIIVSYDAVSWLDVRSTDTP